MDHTIQFMFSLMMMVTMSSAEPLLVGSLTGEQEDTCSIYPVCSDYGQGKHQILEDCRRYFECERQADGTFTQRNWMCEDNLVFTNDLRGCGDPGLAPECKEFGNLKCKLECPRIYFSSSGLSSSSQPESLGCFQLKGSKDLNRVAFYENPNKLTLTPYPAMIWVSWYITANTKCPYSGRLVNEQDKYVRCPRSGWRGWEVRTGGGIVRDEDIVTTCLSGEEEIQTSTTYTTTTTTTTTTTSTLTSSTTSTTTLTTTTSDEILKGLYKQEQGCVVTKLNIGIVFLAVLITGSFNSPMDTAELYLPSTGVSCKLPKLPDNRYSHTVDSKGLLCGGWSSGDTCLQWSPDTGTWEDQLTLSVSRTGHVSWTPGPDIGTYLIGGYSSEASRTTTLIYDCVYHLL